MENDGVPTPHRIMIVDDERPMADALTAIFRKAGYACIVCYSGDTAIALAKAYAPDLLLCDLTMKGLSGQATIASITSLLPDCRVMIHTGDYMALAHAQHAARAQDLTRAFLTKPQPPLVLLREVSKLLHTAAAPLPQDAHAPQPASVA